MKCDKCKDEMGECIQKFHKQYADYYKLNQVNGFCKKCWYEIVATYGTLLDIQVSMKEKQFESSFEREYECIWESSKATDKN